MSEELANKILDAVGEYNDRLDRYPHSNLKRQLCEQVERLIKEAMGDDNVTKEEQVYEVLSPGDCLIISKSNNRLLVARNIGGKVYLEQIGEIKYVYSFREREE